MINRDVNQSGSGNITWDEINVNQKLNEEVSEDSWICGKTIILITDM